MMVFKNIFKASIKGDVLRNYAHGTFKRYCSETLFSWLEPYKNDGLHKYLHGTL